MKTIDQLFILLFICFNLCHSSVYSQNQRIDFTSQWDTVRILKNPYKGWYHHLLDNGIDKYAIRNDSVFASFPGMDHIYLRLAWSYLEPREGEFNWSYIDRLVEKYVPKGYKISFRISCSETGQYPGSVGEQVDGVQYATPSWVAKAGAKGTIVNRGEGRTKSWVPDWDDPIYLEKLDQFHKVFAARYDGQSWVSYVDVGSIGDWGEGHTSSSTKVPPTMSEVKANIDIYHKNYKKSQIVVCDDLLYSGKQPNEVQELYEYAISKGITLRDDSPLVSGYVNRFLGTWTVSLPQFYDPLYLDKPIILETGHYTQVKSKGFWLGKNGEAVIPDIKVSGADILRGAIKIMHATYIGYHGYAEDWLADNPDLARELANRCGYWYFPVNASFPAIMYNGENELSIDWLNKGVAPAYTVFALILRFESEVPSNSFDLLTVNSGNRNWLPGIRKTEKYRIEIPSKAKKGNYIVKFGLLEQTREKSLPIQIGMKVSIIDMKGFVEIGKVVIK